MGEDRTTTTPIQARWEWLALTASASLKKSFKILQTSSILLPLAYSFLLFEIYENHRADNIIPYFLKKSTFSFFLSFKCLWYP